VKGFTFDTITRGLNRRVDAVCLSIIGTSQPGKIGATYGKLRRAAKAMTG